MKIGQLKLLFVRCPLLIFCFILCIASHALAADTLKPVSQNTQNSAPVMSDSTSGDTAFDDFSEFEDVKSVQIFDPLSGYNRFMTRVNDDLYVWAFRPIAKGYRFVAPESVRKAIGRLLTNSVYPVRFVNNLLQLKVKGAGIETARFCVNTTLGIAGLFDPAKTCMGLQAYPEDFGQTLGYYGVGGGFPIVIPVMGPSNLRDLIGRGPDLFLRPTTYIENIWIPVGVTVGGHFNTLSLFMDEYDSLREEAIDLYIFQRDAYRMRRQKAIEE